MKIIETTDLQLRSFIIQRFTVNDDLIQLLYYGYSIDYNVAGDPLDKHMFIGVMNDPKSPNGGNLSPFREDKYLSIDRTHNYSAIGNVEYGKTLSAKEADSLLSGSYKAPKGWPDKCISVYERKTYEKYFTILNLEKKTS